MHAERRFVERNPDTERRTMHERRREGSDQFAAYNPDVIHRQRKSHRSHASLSRPAQ